MTVQVAVILGRKGSEVVTIAPGATLAAAVTALAERNVGALVVSADGQGVDGVVSERDVVRCLAGSGAGALAMTVGEVMTAEVHTCRRDTTADELMATMTARRIRHVPVVEGGRLAGIVSIGDVVKSRIDELETQTEALEGYVTGSSY